MNNLWFKRLNAAGAVLALSGLMACGGDGGGDGATQPSVQTPSVQTISPTSAVVGVPVSLTVTGQNLPLTAVMSVGDASCQTPTNRTATGFTVSCTPGGPPGSKVVTVNTDTQANGGTVIDATRSIAVTSPLTDTGITSSQCYEVGSNVLVACNSAGALALNDAQDGMLGRDVSSPGNRDGKLGFSYSAVTGGCVLDNVTGLMWEVKTADGGLRDMNKTYTNYDSTTEAQRWNGSTYVAPTQAEIDATTNSVGFRNSVNAQGLCGFNDWRLPTTDELQSLVDYGMAYPGPTIDTTWFPNTEGWACWSSSPYVGYSDFAWVVYFNYGLVDPNDRLSIGPVRLVRAGQ